MLDIRPEDFPAAGKCVYLNSASVALMYKQAERAAIAWQQDVAEYGTLHFDEEDEDRVFDELRISFAHLVGTAPEHIAIASSATELIASLAWAVAPPAGKNVVGVDVVFPSTIYPWARVARHTGCELRWVHADDMRVDEEAIIAAIDGNTAAVCLSQAEYGSGQLYDLERIGEAAHRHGALMIVDVSQSVGAVPIDVSNLPVDVIITGSYKWLCGPFGVGLMYVAPDLAMRLDPGIVGWRSNTSIYSLQADRIEFADTARRFEFSTMSYGCAIGLARSIDYLAETGVAPIFAHNLALADHLIEGLRNLDAQIISPTSGYAQSSIVSFRLKGRDSKEIVKRLGADNIIVSPRRDFVRASFHLYNRQDDADALLAALAKL